MVNVPNRQATKGKILLVDDNPDFLQTIQSLATECGYQTLAGEDALNARQIMEEENDTVDILMTDLRMPGEDGISLLQDLGKQHPSLVGILFTGCVETQNAIKAIRAGAIDFLTKPISLSSLRIALARAMAYRRALLAKKEKELELEQLAQNRGKELTKALKHLETSYHFILESLVSLLEAKEKNTGNHTRRVVTLSLLLAKARRLSPEKSEILRLAAYLHDIGKIGIPDEILGKPDRLTKSEWAIMKSHVDIGFRILSRNPYLAEVAEIVRCHHEHYDGSGYPRGLKGEEIPLEARIFTVADAFDGIRSQRAYHPSRTPAETIKELHKNKAHFDPAILVEIESLQQEIETKIYTDPPSHQSHEYPDY
ncbi:MAG: HD domain-containing protein [Opitutales bacterium]|nr:HD domain-containing protein [Opitutales bacterium]